MTQTALNLRADFPTLNQKIHGKPLAYLDSAATAQRPQVVIDAVNEYSRDYNASIHRGVHTLGQKATEKFEAARSSFRRFVNAGSDEEIVFTSGATASLNLVAFSYGLTNLKAGDRVLVSEMDHHSMIVPWQQIARQAGAEFLPIPVLPDGSLDIEAYHALLDERVKVVGFVHVSNALGTVNPVAEMTRMAHEVGAIVVVDGPQAAPHVEIDVQALDVDFYSISCHKMYSPTGIGVLYGRRDLLEAMPPYQLGGGMINSVSFAETKWADVPHKFEAGTPNIAGVIGAGAAAEYLMAQDRPAIEREEKRLTQLAMDRLSEIPGLTLVGTAKDKTSIVSFVMDCAHPHDIGTVLDGEGVAIRAGHHCCMPLMKALGVSATARASFGLYSNEADIDQLVTGVKKVREVFA